MPLDCEMLLKDVKILEESLYSLVKDMANERAHFLVTSPLLSYKMILLMSIDDWQVLQMMSVHQQNCCRMLYNTIWRVFQSQLLSEHHYINVISKAFKFFFCYKFAIPFKEIYFLSFCVCNVTCASFMQP